MELAIALIGIGLIILMTILYMDAHGEVKDYREEIRRQQKHIERLSSYREDLEVEISDLKKGDSLGDPAATWALTHDLIGDALKYNGYKIEHKGDDLYSFIVNDERYIILDGKLPFMQIRITFALNNEWNMELLNKAVAVSNPQTIMAKAFTDDEERSFTAFIDLYEPTYGHLRDCLPPYLKALEAARIHAVDVYNKIKEESEQHPADNDLYKHVLNDSTSKSTMPS